jgi:hypothetical protein
VTITRKSANIRQEVKVSYMHGVNFWTMAMTKHVQKNALAQKRSAVCTAMQNKFGGEWAHRFCFHEVGCLCDWHFRKSDLCQVCADNKFVMLSLESTERRLENPKARCVFHQCFHKAAVGEVRWKEWTAVMCKLAMAQQRPSRFCSLQTKPRLGSMKRRPIMVKPCGLSVKAARGGRNSSWTGSCWIRSLFLGEGPGELLVRDTARQTQEGSRGKKGLAC